MNNYHNVIQSLFIQYTQEAETPFTVTKLAEALVVENYTQAGIQNYLTRMQMYFQKMKDYDYSGMTWPESFNTALLKNLPEELRNTYHQECLRKFPGNHAHEMRDKLTHGFGVLSSVIRRHPKSYEYRVPDFGKSSEVNELRKLMKDPLGFFRTKGLNFKPKTSGPEPNNNRKRPATVALAKPTYAKAPKQQKAAPKPQKAQVHHCEAESPNTEDEIESEEINEQPDHTWVFKFVTDNDVDADTEQALMAYYDSGELTQEIANTYISTSNQCIFCPSSKDHNTDNCTISMQQKIDFVRDGGHCRMCLMTDHCKIEDCPMLTANPDLVCDICKKYKHHKTLCYVGKPAAERPVRVRNKAQTPSNIQSQFNNMRSRGGRNGPGGNRGGSRGGSNANRGRKPTTTGAKVLTTMGTEDTHREEYAPDETGIDSITPPDEAGEYEISET
jgi:hypothetical protein